MFPENIIYFDNAATTKVDEEVIKEMLPFFSENYANPSSIYSFSQKIRKALDDARESIANTLSAKASEIYFTSGGTEANNWALKSICDTLKDKGKHIISSKIEHHSILHTLEYLAKNGFEVTYLDINKEGLIDISQLKNSIRKDTILISIMFANNEIGTIEPIKEIAQLAKENNILFHTDAVQAYAHIPINVNELNIDLLSASAHKFHGPKGVGFLYIKSDVKMRSFIHGGAQERKRRAGTENVAGIIGMAKAASLAFKNMQKNNTYIKNLRDYIIDRLLKEIPDTYINGCLDKRLDNNINVCFDFVEAESILLMLDSMNICASGGSACASGSIDPSHVLLEMGLTKEKAKSSIRISLSKYNTKEEADILIEKLTNIVKRLRSLAGINLD